MSYEEFIRQVTALAGFDDAAEGERASAAALAVLAERLPADVAAHVAEEMPAELGRVVREAPHGEAFEPTALYTRMRQREGVGPGFAVEHAQVVLGVLAAALSPAGLARLREALPATWHPLLEPRTTPVEVSDDEPASPPPAVPPTGNTLATGRPGSSQPVSEARPRGAQRESVVRADNPHGDTKLSSSQGTTQERVGETLAEARAGSRTPVSEARDPRAARSR